MESGTPECGGPVVSDLLVCTDNASREILVRTGTAADSIRVLTTRRTTVKASGGADDVLGGDGIDRLEGAGGGDTLQGGAAGDTLLGAGGPDELLGQAGPDIVTGGRGDDALFGGAGKDTFSGGGGNDYISAKDGVKETVDCGTGNDTVVADASDVVQGNCETVRRP